MGDIMKECIFCKIINGDIPSKKVYEDELVYVIMDINPTVNGHMLVLPKKHYTDFTELDSDILIHINEVSKNLTKTIYDKLGANGIRLVVNYGAYQEVKHYHLHLIPSYETFEELKGVEEIYNKLI